MRKRKKRREAPLTHSLGRKDVLSSFIILLAREEGKKV